MLAGQHGGGDSFPPPPPAPPGAPEWEAADAPLDEYDFCDCPGPPPPPKFVIPPPPPSPSSSVCRGATHPSSEGAPLLQFCHLEPVGAEFTQTAFPSLPIIAVCSSVVLVAVLVASFLLWKHKRKVQNFLPCKSQGRCDLPVGPAGGITYDDVLINHHPTRLPNHHHTPPPPHLTDTTGLTPIELLDVKYGNYIQQHADALTRSNFALTDSGTDYQGVVGGGVDQIHRQTLQHQQIQRQHQPSQQPRGHHQHNSSNHKKKKDHFHPIYEEVSAASDEKIKGGQHSYDSDIEDSEIEGRTVASEDEFAEDELSVAGEYQPSLNRPDDEEEEDEEEDDDEDGEGIEIDQSATSSLRGSTGGDLYPDLVSGSNNRFRDTDHSIGSATSENKGLKNVFRGLELGNALKKHTHSLERNKDGHPSNSFQAKQNYYLNKSMLGPDFTQSCDTPQPNSPDIVSQSTLDACVYPCSRTIGSSLNFVPALQQQQRSSLTSRSAANSPPPPPYAICTGTSSTRHHGNHGGGQGSQNREIISALYNPQVVSPTMSSGRLPDAVLREMAFKMAGESPSIASLATAVGAMSSRSLPVPPSCRAGGSAVLYPMENPYPPPPASIMSGACRARSGSATEFGYHTAYDQQLQHNMGSGRPPTPPPPENIYASIDDDGPFTIDGSRYRGSSSFIPSGRKGSLEFRNTFGKSRPLAAKSGAEKKNNKSSSDLRHPDEKSGSYGDIRSSYDSRTACS